jgi:hypothetical protein
MNDNNLVFIVPPLQLGRFLRFDRYTDAPEGNDWRILKVQIRTNHRIMLHLGSFAGPIGRCISGAKCTDEWRAVVGRKNKQDKEN